MKSELISLIQATQTLMIWHNYSLSLEGAYAASDTNLEAGARDSLGNICNTYLEKLSNRPYANTGQ